MQRTGERSGLGYGVEISGPILPHTKHGLLDLFSQTHKQFSVNFSLHTPSAPFNVQDNVQLENAGDLSGRPSTSGETETNVGANQAAQSSVKTAVKELQYKNGLFSWLA